MYVNAWNVLLYGGLAVYLPLFLMCLMSYVLASPGFSRFYLKSWQLLSNFGTLIHFTITLMTWYANRMYLYEESLSYNMLYYETLGYNMTIYFLFWFSMFTYKSEFT